MSTRKQTIDADGLHRRCPVCGKASYSSNGIHPQCAMAREDAVLRAARKASGVVAERRPARSNWLKQCPKCRRQVQARRMTCDCGHDFALPAADAGNPAAAVQPAGRVVGATVETRPISAGAPMHSAPGADRLITQQVNQKLASRGIRSPCQVDVQTRNGEVTLTGSVQFAEQKQAAVRAVSGVSGVLRVLDQMTVKAAVKQH